MSVLICLWRLQRGYNGGGRSCLRLPYAYMGAVVVLAILCYGGGEPPFIGAEGAWEGRPSPPQLRSPWTWSMTVETTVGAEKPPSARTVSLLVQAHVGDPTIDVHLARSASFPPCTKEESLVVRRAGTATLCSPLIINLVSAARASPRLMRCITLRPLAWPCASCCHCFASKQPSGGQEGLKRNAC